MSSAPSDPIESLIVHLGQLELTITVRHRDRNTRDPLPSLSLGSSSQPSTRSYSGASWEPVSTAPGFAPGLTHQALQAETAAELAALDLSHLGSARSHLTAQDSVWVPAARLGRAFKAGVVARARLDSEYRTESSPAIPFKNSYYVVLRSRENGPGFWTNSYSSYISRVGNPRTGRDFESTTISHAFPSFAECAAYVSGAQVSWPPEL